MADLRGPPARPDVPQPDQQGRDPAFGTDLRSNPARPPGLRLPDRGRQGAGSGSGHAGLVIRPIDKRLRTAGIISRRFSFEGMSMQSPLNTVSSLIADVRTLLL